MSQDDSAFDSLPDDGGSAGGHGRQTRVIVSLLVVLLAVGAAVVVWLLAGQQPVAPDELAPSASASSTEGPSDAPSEEPTTGSDLDAAVADLESARATLATALTSAEGLLAATEHMVADNGSRISLSDALTAARSVLDADVDLTRVDDVQSLTTRTRGATANVQHVAGLVADSHEEWLTRQAATPDPDAPTPGRPVPSVPGDREPLPGLTGGPDRTPRPGPAPIPVPDDQR